MKSVLIGGLVGLLCAAAIAEEIPDKEASALAVEANNATEGADASLDQQVESLKQQVLALNRDLFILEEELLFPANTQVAVFLSMDVGTFFALDSVQVKLDDKEIAAYLYTDRESQALFRGGVQRLYMGNLPAGEHELVAFFTGKGPHGRDYRRGTTLVFEKSLGPKFVELKIGDQTRKLQPEFTVRDWD